MIDAGAPKRQWIILMMPVKRRQALVAIRRSGNSQPELIADDGQGTFFPAGKRDTPQG
jgi:hypothetical protein